MAAPVRAQTLETLNGTWEGSVVSVAGSGLTTLSKPMEIRLVIAGAKAQVFFRRSPGKNFDEIKPGQFRVSRVKSNAIVAAIDSGHDKDGTWVETWEYAVTMKDANTLIANWVRVVNNVDLPLSVKYSKFSAVATGELHRSR